VRQDQFKDLFHGFATRDPHEAVAMPPGTMYLPGEGHDIHHE
jgi:hypothetical protein